MPTDSKHKVLPYIYDYGFSARKQARIDQFELWKGIKATVCVSCSGSGYYTSRKCGNCNGTGKEFRQPYLYDIHGNPV